MCKMEAKDIVHEIITDLRATCMRKGISPNRVLGYMGAYDCRIYNPKAITPDITLLAKLSGQVKRYEKIPGSKSNILKIYF